MALHVVPGPPPPSLTPPTPLWLRYSSPGARAVLPTHRCSKPSQVTITPRFDETIQLLLPSSADPLGHPPSQDAPPLKPILSPPPSNPHRCVEVTHLSPLALYVRYHTDYPSSRPPDFHLSARWLDPKLSSFVSKKLEELFTPEYPVVFDWITYLQDEFILDYTALQRQASPAPFEANIPPIRSSFPISSQTPTPNSSGNDIKSKGLPREAVADDRHPCQMFLRSTSQLEDMEEYDQFEAHKEFLAETHVCEVCFLEVPGRAFCEPCASCRHLFCRECIREYCQVFSLITSLITSGSTLPHCH